VTSQGYVSVPTDIQRRLGVRPGSLVEWVLEGDTIVVRRVGQYTFKEVHEALFEKPPKARTVAELKEGIQKHIRRRHARR